MEITCSSETSNDFQRTTQRCILEDRTPKMNYNSNHISDHTVVSYIPLTTLINSFKSIKIKMYDDKINEDVYSSICTLLNLPITSFIYAVKDIGLSYSNLCSGNL